MGGPVLAVLGGGQLGRMLGLAALPLGARCRFLDPAPDAGAGAVGELVVGALDDPGALDRVAEGADAVTFEWEGVPADAARRLAARLPVFPGPEALAASQDRQAEKAAFARLGIPTAHFAAVDSRVGLARAVDEVGLPALLKTRRGGYDGKGQHRIDGADDGALDGAWGALGGVPLILERVVPFTRELSVLAVRDRAGATRCWPLVENEHRDGILRTSRAPAPGVTPELQGRAERYATRLLDEWGYVGVLAVELFDVDGELLANEVAPRVHNSGHWTIEGATTSQFENHVRAVLGWPLGATDAVGVSAMVNCIGALPEPGAVLAVPGAHLHVYGKAPRPDRKVGHITVTASSPDVLQDRLAQLSAHI